MDLNENNETIKNEEFKPQINATSNVNGVDLNQFKSKSNNFYSKVLYYLGWGITILGIIGSIILASENSYYGGGTIFLIGLLSSLISGFMILGLSEIINILDESRRLLSSMATNSNSSLDE